MWHILAAEPGAKIAAGFREPITEAEVARIGALGRNRGPAGVVRSAPGRHVFHPAGTVHAIGAGLTLCEIQQWSDITYRLFDYGRPRELHLDEGARVSRLGPHAARQSAREGVLVSCPFFTTEKLRVDGDPSVRGGRGQSDDRCARRRGEDRQRSARAGEAWYTPMPEPIDLNGHATLLRTYTS